MFRAVQKWTKSLMNTKDSNFAINWHHLSTRIVWMSLKPVVWRMKSVLLLERTLKIFNKALLVQLLKLLMLLCQGHKASVKYKSTSKQHVHINSTHACSISAALLQTYIQFVGWYCCCILSWWVYAGHCRWPPSIAVCWQSNMHCQEVM